jgi:hypothetical protein
MCFASFKHGAEDDVVFEVLIPGWQAIGYPGQVGFLVLLLECRMQNFQSGVTRILKALAKAHKGST